jgi:hypothetical protein
MSPASTVGAPACCAVRRARSQMRLIVRGRPPEWVQISSIASWVNQSKPSPAAPRWCATYRATSSAVSGPRGQRTDFEAHGQGRVLGLPEQRGELAPADEQDVEGPDLVSVGMLIDFQQALEFDEQLGPERLRVVDAEEHPLPLDDHVAEIPPERLREVATGGLTVGQPPLPEDLSEIDQVEGWGGEPPHPHPVPTSPLMRARVRTVLPLPASPSRSSTPRPS